MGKREGIMLCHPFEQKRLDKWDFPVIVQPKLDGLRCRAVFCDGKLELLSSEKNVFTSVPHIEGQLNNLLLPRGTYELDGELYTHGMSFEEIESIASRTVNLHPRYYELEYHIFDMVNEAPQGTRVSLTKDLRHDNIIPVEYHIAKNLEEIMHWYHFYLELDYEGIIVRNIFWPYERKRSGGIMKFKPKKVDHYKIVGCEEAIDAKGNPKGMLGAFTCTGSDGNLFSVGAGCLDHADRVSIWNRRGDYLGMVCVVQYQNITSNGVPRFGLTVSEPKDIWNDNEATIHFLKGLR